MRVIDAGKTEVTALGFAPVSCVLLAAFRGGGASSFGPVGADAGARITAYRPARFDFTPDGHALLSTDPRGRLWAIDPTTRAKSEIDLPGSSEIVQSGLSADGTRLVTTHGEANFGAHAAWRPVNGKWQREWLTPISDLVPHSLAVCPTGARLAHIALTPEPEYHSDLYEVRTRDAATGAHEATGAYRFRAYLADRLYFRPDGRQLLAVFESRLAIWPVPDLGIPHIVRNDSRKHFTAAAYHPNSRHLFTTSNDTFVTVWDVQTWEPVRRFAWDIGRLRSVTVSPDGTVAAAGSARGRIVVWDLDV